MPGSLPPRPHSAVFAYVEPVRRWEHEVSVKHLMTREEDAFSVGTSMIRIGEVLQAHAVFGEFAELPRFFEEDDLETANDLLESLYDYCDARGIWLC